MIDEIYGRVFEEMAELEFEICKHYFRGKANKLLIAHEIADTYQAIQKLVNELDIEKEVQLAKKELEEYENSKKK
jgi:hypothetical protein